MRPFESAGPWTLPSEKVTTQVRIGAGHSKEERQRIICCCRQVLHQESEPLGERFGRTSEDQAISPKPPTKSRFLSRLFLPPSRYRILPLFSVFQILKNIPRFKIENRLARCRFQLRLYCTQERRGLTRGSTQAHRGCSARVFNDFPGRG